MFVWCFFSSFLRLSHERSHSSFIQRIVCVSLRTAMYSQPTVNHQFFFSLTLSLFLYLTYSRCLHCQFVPICDWWNEITPCFFFFCLFIRGGIAKFHNDAQYQFPCSCAANCIYAILINFSKSLMRFKCAPQHTLSLSRLFAIVWWMQSKWISRYLDGCSIFCFRYALYTIIQLHV